MLAAAANTGWPGPIWSKSAVWSVSGCWCAAGGWSGTKVEVGYAITSPPPARADAATLLGGLRGHWGIENRSHWVRDVTFDEDRCQIRTGAAPEAFAACRNLTVALLRRGGHENIAAALRTYAARPHRAVALVLSGGSG